MQTITEHTTAAHEATAMYGGGEVALGLQQVVEVVDRGERVRMPIAEGLALHLQRLAQRGSALTRWKRACPGALGSRGTPLQRLTVQRLSGGAPALGVQEVKRKELSRPNQPVVLPETKHCPATAQQQLLWGDKAVTDAANKDCFGVIKP
eukprot:scaffold42776_cov60-Phaeocystis_antarctica.AAC.2